MTLSNILRLVLWFDSGILYVDFVLFFIGFFESKMPRDYKVRCREIAAYALRVGWIKKPERCEECGNRGPLVKHHDRYDEPLKVTWLCFHCHGVLEGAKRRRSSSGC